MSIIDFFRARKKAPTASVAKERLQIIVAHERGQRDEPDYLPALQKELVDVIRKYDREPIYRFNIAVHIWRLSGRRIDSQD